MSAAHFSRIYLREFYTRAIEQVYPQLMYINRGTFVIECAGTIRFGLLNLESLYNFT